MKHLLITIALIAIYGSAVAQFHQRKHNVETHIPAVFSDKIKHSSIEKSVYLENKPTLDSIISHGFDSSGETWLPIRKEIYKYEKDGTSLFYYSDYWYEEDDYWERNKIQISFNERGDVSLELRSTFENGEFVPAQKHEYNYYENGLLSERIVSYYNQGAIMSMEREVYEYNENDFVKKILEYSRVSDDQTWEYNGKLEYEYDEQGNTTNVKMTDYDSNGDEISNFLDWRQTSYMYSPEGNLDSVLYQAWKEETNGWVVDSKSKYTYNSAGQELSEKYYEWDEESGKFELVYNDEWTYDTYGNNTTYIFREKGYISDEWSVYKDTFIFDHNALLKDYTLPEYFVSDLPFTNKVTGYKNYELIESKWILTEESKCYYSDDIQTGTNQKPLPEISISQNTNSFSASWDSNVGLMTLDVFNLSGKKVYGKKIRNRETIALDFLPNGIYLYKLHGRNTAVTGKLPLINSN